MALGASFALLVTLSACGSSGSNTTAEAQLRAARKAGEEAARERDRVNSLQKQVNNLKHRVRHSTPAPSNSAGTGASGTPASNQGEESLREFHVASGNVSCEITNDGATCTVEPIAETFVFSGGQPAYTESGSTLPQDLGEVVPYGSTVAVGSISCEIPPSNVPRGITCDDAGSGHGFEASRVSGRQHVY